jgi:plastocyanin
MNKSCVVFVAAGILAVCALASAQPGPTQKELKQADRGTEFKNGMGTIAGKLKSPFLRRSPALVYIENVAGRQFAPPAKNPVMDQKNLIFIPHLLPVLVGSTVDFPNNDTVRHNVFTSPKSVKQFNLGTYPVGEVKHVTFDKVGVVTLLCNVHAEMTAYVVVLQNPYFALTDKDGAVTLGNVPEGEYTLTFWHEGLKSISKPIKVTQQQITEVQFENLAGK